MDPSLFLLWASFVAGAEHWEAVAQMLTDLREQAPGLAAYFASHTVRPLWLDELADLQQWEDLLRLIDALPSQESPADDYVRLLV